MVYQTENQIKNELGINNWRNLLNDKMILFTSLMPKMELAVMNELLGQLPQFWHFSKEILKMLETRSPIGPESFQASPLLELRRLLDRDFDTEHNKPELKKQYFEIIMGMAEPFFSEAALSDADRKFINSVRDQQDCGTRTMLIAILSYMGGRLQQQAI